HGTPDGMTVNGQTIDAKLVVNSLRDANDILLLHIDACLVLKEESAGAFSRRLGQETPYPISGYATSIDWGGSALLDFCYLDMILGKGLPPEQAAERLPKMVAFAADQAPAGSPYP